MTGSETKNKPSGKIYVNLIKPVFDFIFALILSLALLPVILLTWLAVFMKFGNPVLFRQKRPGKNEKEFCIYKFRTMTNEKDQYGNLLSDTERLTKFGLFLRKTSLDELPQLINVLKGELSFIGPRPLLVEYLPLYNNFQKKRHNVRPGITGWAQVNGRNAITWEDKFKFDAYYVDNVSFILDLKILFKTINKVVKRSDINNVKGETMEKFTGNK